MLGRLVPLWASARKAEFLWSNVFLACQANVNLVRKRRERERDGVREGGRGYEFNNFALFGLIFGFLGVLFGLYWICLVV